MIPNLFSALHAHPFAHNSFATFYTQGHSPQSVLMRALTQNTSVTITGPQNSGKTHLLQALSGHMTHHGINHLLTSSSLLTKAIVSANRHKNLPTLKAYLLEFPLILIDNIHALLRSKAAQDLILCSMEHNTTIIATTFPRQSALLHPKIFDRIKGALTLPLPEPSPTHEHHILTIYAQSINATISQKEWSFLHTSPLDITTKKAVISLKARKGVSIESMLLQVQPSPQKLLPKTIINAISATQHITALNLCKKRPQKSVKDLQDLCIFLCRTHGTSAANLCTLFNKKYYASIHASCGRAQTLLSHNASMFEVLRDIEKHLTATA